MREKVILVIDDDEMNLQIAKMILEKKLKCKVIGADNGFDGIEMLRSRRADLVLLDVMMPEFDGIETLQEIRSDKRIKDVPIMMLTASGDIEVIQKVGALGVKDYIKKPFMPADLIDRISKKLAELASGAEILLLGNDDKTLRNMRKIIEEDFNHNVTLARNSEEILNADEVNLIIACADMDFIDGVKFLSVIADEERFNSVPFALTTPEKLRELFEKTQIAEPPEIEDKPAEEPPIVEEVAQSAVVHSDKKKLAKVVTSFIGYELDLKV